LTLKFKPTLGQPFIYLQTNIQIFASSGKRISAEIQISLPTFWQKSLQRSRFYIEMIIYRVNKRLSMGPSILEETIRSTALQYFLWHSTAQQINKNMEHFPCFLQHCFCSSLWSEVIFTRNVKVVMANTRRNNEKKTEALSWLINSQELDLSYLMEPLLMVATLQTPADVVSGISL
jgi:hypothetical protein